MRLTAIRAELKVDVDLEIRLGTMAVGLLLTLFDPDILAHTVGGLAGGAANRKGELGSLVVLETNLIWDWHGSRLSSCRALQAWN